ncbi:MAG: pgeF [Clostridiales bacterium]|jgi:YfiH family protein|nr:pgeF [Clostridiales bacterium]
MNSKVVINRINDLEFYTAPNLTNIEFTKHFFSTRVGGISTGVYESLNLGLYTNDAGENVQYNLNKIFSSTKMNVDKITYLKQVHSDKIFRVNKDNYLEVRGQEGDALITSEKGIPIGVFTADCVPIILVDSYNKIAAVVHAGWKGTALNITGKVLKYMQQNMGTNFKNVVGAVGPSIGPCCFEVGPEVAKKFNFVYENENRLYVDLWKENIRQITDIGVPEEKITNCMLCTSCNSNIVFSYRKESGNTGRLGTFVEIL